MYKYIKLFLIVITGSLLACNLSDHKPLLIEFSADSSKIILSNIDPAGVLQLKNKLKTDTIYQKLVSVLQTPTDDDSTSMEIEWPGKLSLQNDQLVFTPDTAFKKGKSYLVETIINSKFATAKEIVTSDVGYRLKRTQKLLVR